MSPARVISAQEQKPGTTRTLLAGGDGGLVRRTVLPGGLRVVTEVVPHVRSAAVGLWVGVGSRDETPAQAGCSHYLEHLLFKGTPTRSALDISSSIDAVGGEMNAFTSKEYTCYYARVLDENVPLAIDVVTDMVTSSLVRTPDVDGERGVILEEIAMRDDDPSDLVHDEFATALFGDSTIGRPVLGTGDSIRSLARRTINSYYRRTYRPEDIVVAVAGNIDHATVVRLVKKAVKNVGWLDGDAAPSAPRAGRKLPELSSGVRLIRRDTEQANFVLGVPGLGRDDDRRWAMSVLNAALGGGMSSRLFQEVREKRGLAYSVYSYHQEFAEIGAFGVYAGCPPQRFDEVLSLCREELDKVIANGITDEELRRAQGQLKGGLVLGLEDSGSRMSRIGKGELVRGEVMSIDHALRKISDVTLADVHAVAEDVLAGPAALAVVGPFDDEKALAKAVA